MTVIGDRLHVMRCNHCREFVLNEHRAMHALDCRAKRNREKLGAMNLEKNGQALYAVAATRRRRGRWSAPVIEHVHANDPAHARAQFMAGEIPPAQTRIIDIGLAIGVFCDETNGKLSL